MVFLKEFLEKVDFEKKSQQMTKKHKIFMFRVNETEGQSQLASLS